MTTVELGFEPYPLVVHLVAGADFAATIRTQSGEDWPDGTAITLRIETTPDPTDFPATINDDVATWTVDKDAIDALTPGTQLKARVLYTDNSSADLEWFVGWVEWHV